MSPANQNSLSRTFSSSDSLCWACSEDPRGSQVDRADRGE
jgi:hypothetical protein